MNDIINWIAINNTLMIRIGFIAILILLVIYIFRFFFIPKIIIVNESLDLKETKNITEKNKESEHTESDEPIFEEKLETITNQNFAEIEKFKFEVSKLKSQLSESEALVSQLQTTNVASEENENGPAGINESPAMDEEAAVVEVKKKLNKKIEQLESRLSEYEIIAEDISEIGQLRKENAELKQKLDKEAATVETASEELFEINESVPETSEISDAVLEAMLQTPENSTPPDENASSSIKLTSEKVVTKSERELIDQFEEISSKKGS